MGAVRDYLDSFARDINSINADLNSTPESRRRAHQAHFFSAINQHYEFRQKVISEYVQGSNIMIPQFDVSREVMPDVFSYFGYDETDKLRDTAKKDAIVAAMLDESLSQGPAMVIDIGTYDGKRTRSLVDRLKNKKNIAHLVGIDTNPVVLNAFDSLDVPNTIFNYDARKVLGMDPSFMFYPVLARIPIRKIYLGLENVAMNLVRLSGCEHQNFVGTISRMLGAEDTVILELANFLDPTKYVDGVEQVFHNYFRESGLQELIGGELRAEEQHESPQKMIMIDEVKEYVEFNGREYHFARPELKWMLNVKKPDGSDDFMMTDMFSKPIIFLGISQALPREEVFTNLIMFYVNHLMLEKQQDLQFVDSEMVMKLRKDPSVKVVSDEALNETLVQTYIETERRGLKPLFKNLTDVIIGTGQYPSFYNLFLERNDQIFLENPFHKPSDYELSTLHHSRAVQCVMSRRIGKIDPRVQQNLNRYIPLLFSGRAKELAYDPWHGAHFEVDSLISVNMPR